MGGEEVEVAEAAEAAAEAVNDNVKRKVSHVKYST